MKKTIILLAALSLPALAGQSNPAERYSELIKSLSEKDFDEREGACEELSGFPAEFSARLLKTSKTSSLETRTWLLQASKAIFLRKILPQDERYRRLFGIVGMELDPESNYSYEGCGRGGGMGGGGGGQGNGPDPFGYRVKVTFPMTDADKVFKKWDLIVKVDGKPACDFFGHGQFIDFGFFKPGDVHEFEVWRYKDLEKVYQRGWPKDDEDEHEVITVKTKVDTKEPWHVDMEKLNWLKERAWKEFQMVQDDEPGLRKSEESEK